jgi:DNA-binding CsgD family transcriptional regulator
MATQAESAILEKLDQLIRLVAIQVASDKSLTERARLLKLAGVDNRTIADVLNTSPATIRSLTTNLRKRSRKAIKKPPSQGQTP